MARHPITVWRYEDAPEELQISTNGGDEDWLAEIPPGYSDIQWMEAGGPFGCCCIDVHHHPKKVGWTIKIGCHS